MFNYNVQRIGNVWMLKSALPCLVHPRLHPLARVVDLTKVIVISTGHWWRGWKIWTLSINTHPLPGFVIQRSGDVNGSRHVLDSEGTSYVTACDLVSNTRGWNKERYVVIKMWGISLEMWRLRARNRLTFGRCSWIKYAFVDFVSIIFKIRTKSHNPQRFNCRGRSYIRMTHK